jgi:nucleoside transporter
MTPALSARTRISALLFFHYFAVGSWFVSLGVYMSKSLGFDAIIGTAYGMFGIGTMAATLFVGAVADRYFAAQRLLGILLLCGGAALLLLATVRESQPLFLGVLLLHCLLTSAAIPLGVSIAFTHLPDPQQQFPAVRTFGSVGWMVAGLVVGLWPGAAQTALPLQMAGVVYMLTGLYAFTLPHTPPKAKAQKLDLMALLGLDIMRRQRDRVMWVFIIALVLVGIPKKFYDSLLNTFLVEKGVALQAFGITLESTGVLTLGQIIEALTLLALPFVAARIGIKWVMVMGMAAWVLRFLLFAFGFDGDHAIVWMVLLGIFMHGLSYDFFFISGQIWFDQQFAASMRSRAQSFYWFLLNGVGVAIGANIAGGVFQAWTLGPGQRDWASIWLVPSAITAVAMVLFVLTFHERRTAQAAGEA